MIPFSIHQFFVHHAIGRAFGTLCRLSSVMFCIVAKRYVLAKNRHCLKEWIGNQGQKVDFLGHRHISTSGFTSMATETAIFARTAQRSALDGTNGFSSSKGKCLFLPDYGPLGLGLVLRLGSMVGHPSNSWASLLHVLLPQISNPFSSTITLPVTTSDTMTLAYPFFYRT